MIIAGCIGNAVEWYNFLVYAYLAVVVAQKFFPEVTLQHGLILSFLLFAVGFISRPLGALIFGVMGDRLGRQKTLLISQIGMAVPTLLICLLPTYIQIGFAAPVLLGLLRFLQGISVGGEQPTSLIYLAEMAPIHRRGLWVSVIPCATAFGILLASVIVYGLMHVLTAGQFSNYGWRLAFFSGFIITMIATWYRWTLPESKVFLAIQHTKVQTRSLITQHYFLQIIFMMALVVAQAFFYQLFYVWTPNFLHVSLSVSLTQALLINILIMLVFCGAIVLGGYWVDQIGRRCLLLVSLPLLLISSGFLYFYIQQLSVVFIFLGLAINFLIFGWVMGTISTLFTEIFPAKIRALTLSLAFNIPLALVGGLTPLFLQLVKTYFGSTEGIALGCVIVAALALLAGCFVDDKTGEPV